MNSSGATPSDHGAQAPTREVQDWAGLGEEVWSFLTGRGAAVNYSFVDMTVEVPRDTGADAPRATWRLNGTLRITTSDREYPGAGGPDQHTGER